VEIACSFVGGCVAVSAMSGHSWSIPTWEEAIPLFGLNKHPSSEPPFTITSACVKYAAPGPRSLLVSKVIVPVRRPSAVLAQDINKSRSVNKK
jgi:hypothetical protein